jgi:demethylmenaquinone methyltransferase/2-methoxy-6-polyprenyl-1,4-benzoquinol methylase
LEVKPYKEQEGSKKEQVAQMFDNISPKYDFLNRFLSLGIDIQWRKKLVKIVRKQNPKTILDVATGTADLAIELSKIEGTQIAGVDISAGMLNVGKEKIKKKNLDHRIELKLGDGEELPFEENSFDAVTISFGIRNFQDYPKGLKDIYRVIKPGGYLYVLEFSQPESAPFKQIYNFYFKYILPKWGKLVSKDNAAYTYLPESVEAFPYGQKFLDAMTTARFKESQLKELTFGISTIYWGKK